MWYDKWIEQNKLPDWLLRRGIRKLLRERLREEDKGDPEAQQAHLASLIEGLKTSPIAINTAEANQQHYEVPAAFYKYCLGKHLKYSCGYWKPGVTSLDQAEQDMLDLTCSRAELRDGQQVLELGCGWGSLSLFMATRYPASRFTVVSNSHSQKEYIDGQARERGLQNLRVITADMNNFGPGAQTDGNALLPASFDRVVSVEMFEHMRNYQRLMERISSFLKQDGRLFVHIFSHTERAYLFEVRADNDWMSKYFFTGGIMPSDHLLLYFNDHLSIERHWRVSGMHYARTAEAWLRNMDGHRAQIMPILEKTYGKDQSVKWWAYWRLFYLACAELWSFRQGREWIVSHYLFRKTTIAKTVIGTAAK
jgi:cyclopropane-fatty-acyl-phospholipid synthase